ncbi:uncharacterized protein LAESUDRAFT_728315 [Laetiporus sulphureus 93-53]|uniref:Uncharacterized protein n=1 Tax=Laetiporus sulphureus 93-53 TaxID=1314785 RepID=A0A165D454_9APHY|nr:uncharacterized protein LAESUDRAFT_728315 [Laetiporus sulphureus 93-53]KZT04117.1 hypothetical protein LAESUDRAFT_728315 [Laetiporus sulphureus 93-53]
MSVNDPLANALPSASAHHSLILISTTPSLHDPPPPYPSQERRTRTTRSGRRRRTIDQAHDNVSHVPIIHTAGSSDYETPSPSIPHQYDADDRDNDVSETTPLLLASPRSPARLPPGGITRQRTLSLTSTVPSSASVAPSFAQTVLSAFNPERDCDVDPECEEHVGGGSESEGRPDSPPPLRSGNLDDEQRAFVAELASGHRQARQRHVSWTTRWRRYFRPMGKRAYYAALFHLLLLNFPYALLAWLYLFVLTVAGTTTLMALPLGAVLCFLDLIGARVISRGELALQTTFHGPLAHSVPHPPLPIFIRLRPPTQAELEAGLTLVPETSFYRNAYAMFTDPTSYQALFYFLVIKPGITILTSLFLLLLVPLSFVLVFPAPAALRLARRLGIWQANVALEGLCLAVR